MDITINVGIGVTDDSAVVLVDDLVLQDFYKVHVTTLEEHFVAIILDNILAVSLGFVSSAVNTISLVAIEDTYGLTDLSLDGSTQDVGLEGTVVVGQCSYFILVMTDRGTDFPTEILQAEYLCGGMQVEAVVFKLAFIAPAGIQSAGPGQLTEREEVASVTLEVVEAQVQAVIEEVSFDSCC